MNWLFVRAPIIRAHQKSSTRDSYPFNTITGNTLAIIIAFIISLTFAAGSATNRVDAAFSRATCRDTLTLAVVIAFFMGLTFATGSATNRIKAALSRATCRDTPLSYALAVRIARFAFRTLST